MIKRYGKDLFRGKSVGPRPLDVGEDSKAKRVLIYRIGVQNTSRGFELCRG